MLNWHPRALTCLAAAALIACGSGKPPPEAVSPQAKPQAAAEPPADLSPVAAPTDLIAVARLNRPGELLDTVVSWTNLPVDLRAMLEDEVPGIGRVLLMDAPVDAVAVLGASQRAPDVAAAVSFGLSSLEAALAFAKERGDVTRRLAPGVYRVGDAESTVCVAARAVGVAPARLVCGGSSEDVETLLPYMTRGLPREAVGARDLHAELRLEPVRRRFGTKLRQLRAVGLPLLIGELGAIAPGLEGPLTEVANGVADEGLALFEDIDVIELDLQRTSPDALELSLGLRVRQDSSWFASVMREMAKRSAPAPDRFWALPADATMAGYTVGAGPERLAPVRKTVQDLLTAVLAKADISQELGAPVAALFMDWALDGGRGVYAHGAVTVTPEREPSAETPRLRERLLSKVGWYVANLEQDPAVYKKRLDELTKLLDRREIRAAAAKKLELSVRDLPSVKARPYRQQGAPAGTTEYQLVLPSAFLDWIESEGEAEAETAAKPKAKPKAEPPLTMSLLLLPNGETTLLAIAGQAKDAWSKLDLVRRQAAEGTLRARAGLESLQTQPAVSGGFFTLRGLLESADLGGATLNTTPGRGEVPLLYTLTAAPSGPALARWTFRMPRAALQDAVAAGVARAARRH